MRCSIVTSSLLSLATEILPAMCLVLEKETASRTEFVPTELTLTVTGRKNETGSCFLRKFISVL